MSVSSTLLSRRAWLKSTVAALFIGTALAGCGERPAAANKADNQTAQTADSTFYLVRHAEKELEGDDPALSEAGYARADALAEVLRDVKLDAIYSTDTRRTRDTAAPTISNTNLDLKIYDGRDLETFARELSTVTGTYLIVGHSNTTPALVDALGGEGGTPIVEATEYDRLYVLTRKDGAVTTDLRRFP